jgi:hypothetical protein
MNIWEKKWFIDFTAWCCKWDWWKRHMWGEAINTEDYVRNFGEIFRETYWPFIFKNVKSYSVINLRCGYIPFHNAPEIPKCCVVPMGDRKYVWEGKEFVHIDLRIWNPWYTKFCNAKFFFQFAISLWHYIPIPYVSMCIRYNKGDSYFQFGIGWGPESRVKNSAVMAWKFRFVNEVTSNEQAWNPQDVSKYWEGTI